MTRFTQHTRDSAPVGSRAVLATVEADFGMVPNLERTLAESPAALEGYATLWALFETTSLTPVERQVVYQTANFENRCSYCVPWHTLLAEKAGMSPGDSGALRDGTPLDDPKLEALRRFCQALIDHRGHPPEVAVDAFFGAGYTPRHALEVILGLATKTISNFTNGLAGTPLDPEVAHLAWHAPSP